MIIHPYLTFNGNCEEAMTFYQSVFGGEFTAQQRFSEALGNDVDPADADRMMHMSLPVGDSALMASDTTSDMDPVPSGHDVSLSVDPEDVDEARRIFDALAEGGTVTLAFEPQFWGDWFGSCTDRFGIDWMVNASAGD
ncbi:VOC family protein [Salsipaludibacter albus]|uniref:VOC family protein n=1 Tax=Salsipaludibacter albus TaxID=2849650 RepID=UPI001EE46991|nr:VOC family protein [Salsipaludibacter albus]MBY5162165.1 VOC family protein [Salsipaludibacter albus]